jgi:hypothetical protein
MRGAGAPNLKRKPGNEGGLPGLGRGRRGKLRLYGGAVKTGGLTFVICPAAAI